MIEIENYQDVRGGSVEASFTVYISNFRLRIHNMKLIRTKTGKQILGFPSYSTEDQAGKKSWHPLIEFSKEKSEDFKEKVFEALKPFVSGSSFH